jgi:hypothetical protein
MRESQRKYSQLDAEACLETVHLQFAIRLYRLYSNLSCIGDVLYACVCVFACVCVCVYVVLASAR